MEHFYIYLGSVLLAIAATPLAMTLARKLRIFDHPRPRSIHARSVPRTGGIAMVLATVTVLAVALAATGLPAPNADLSKLVWVLAGGLLLAAVGLIDDKQSLPVWVKLLAQTIAALAVWTAGVRIEFVWINVVSPWHFGWLSAPITVAWILIVVNALNLADGLDGLAAGIAAIACGAIGVLALLTGQPLVAALALAVAGAASGFLVFNFHPARIFMGDCGSLFLGFIIACGSVMCTAHSSNLVSLALPTLALGIPILDLMLAVPRRIMSRHSIVCPDRSHIHHRMLERGLGQRQVALLMYAASLAAVGVGTFMFVVCGYRSLMIFICVVLLLGMVFRWAGALPFTKMLRALQRNLAMARQAKADQQTIEESLARLSQARNLESWWNGVCLAADRMGFKSLSMEIGGPAEGTRSRQWQAASHRLDEHGVISIDLTPEPRESRRYIRLTCYVPVNGLAELAGRRAALFGRLIDETATVPDLVAEISLVSLPHHDGLRSDEPAAHRAARLRPQGGNPASPLPLRIAAAGKALRGA